MRQAGGDAGVRRLGARVRVVLLTIALWAFAALVTVVLYDGQHWGGASAWPWWLALPVLIAGFALTEVFVVHLRLRADAHTFSLVEMPIAIGIFFAQPLVLVAAQLLGAGAALAVHRRQSPLKLAFNTGVFVATTLAAVAVFRAIVGDPTVVGQRALLIGGTSLVLEAALSVTLVFVVISISTGTWRPADLRSGLGFGVTAAVFTSSLGVIAVVVVDAQPGIAWLLAIPTAGTYLANWAYSTQRRRHEGLDFLYRSAQLLHGSDQLEPALVQLLRHSCETFNTEAAELVYITETDEAPMWVRVRHGDGAEAGAQLDDRHSALLALMDRDEAVTLDHNGDADVLAFLGASHYRDAIIAPMRGERRVVGALVVANRLSEVVGFDTTDARLAETLANHTATALENGRLEQSLEQLRVLEGRLTFQALHDPLTGLANRTLFRSELDAAIGEHGGTRGTVLFIDLDDFKTVNDSFGHAVGDALLVDVAARLRRQLGETGTIARLGGDEFAVLLPDVTIADEARVTAERLLDAFRTPVTVAHHRLSVRASVGIALIEPGSDPEALMRSADTAMYTAKAQGKHRVVLFQPEMYESNLQRFNLQSELRRAIDEQELVVHFQPIVSIGTRDLIGVEALVRWRHPSLGLLAPDNFLPLAEESDLIAEIDRIVLSSTCAWLAALDRESPGLVPRADVNLSPRTIASAHIVERVAAELGRHGLDASRLGIEITENLMAEHAEEAVDTLTGLRRLGVHLSLDDFGTGYSSLSHLRSLPVDAVKVARPFIDDVDTSESQHAFVAAIVALAGALGLTVIAEGIERPEQLTALRALHCHAGQGYLFAHALAPDALADWARLNRSASRTIHDGSAAAAATGREHAILERAGRLGLAGEPVLAL